MKKCFIFSQMFGDYEYGIEIIQANSFEEACKKVFHDGQQAKIQGFNYDPYLDPSRRITLSFKKDSEIQFTKEELEIFKHWNEDKVNWIINNYSRVVGNTHYDDRKSISGITYLRTEEEGWYDWIEGELNVPDNYIFRDGHSG